MARLLSIMLLAVVMTTWQSKVRCLAQTDQEDLRQGIEEKTLGAKQQSGGSSFISKLSNFLPSFMNSESSPPVRSRGRSEKQPFYDTSSSTKRKHTETKEPLSVAFSKTLSQNDFPETSQTLSSLSIASETPGVRHAYPLWDTTSPETSRQSAIQEHQISERAASFATSSRAAHDSEPTNEGPVDDLYPTSTSSGQFGRSSMEIPVRFKMDLFSGSTSSKGKQSLQEDDKDPVLLKIKEYGKASASLPTRGEVIRIGDAEIPRRKVTVVGDVDGNKITDYIVSNIAAKNYSGTVRLYLMGEGDSFLYTRDLVPGNWGFEHPELNPGDRFGATVFRLPSTGSSSQCFIAITAPGDRSTKDENGSVYVLELTEKGNVNNHTKLSAAEFLKLVEEQKKDEQTRGVPSEKPSQTVDPQTSGLQQLGGVTSMLFLNATGGVQAVMNVEASKHNNLLRYIETHLASEKEGKRTVNFGMDHFSSRVAQDESCLFSKTECACQLEAFARRNGECFEVFQSREKGDKVICMKKSCPPVYRCSCDGKTTCRRVEEMEEVYTPEGRGDRGELYCTYEERLVSKTIPLTDS